MKRILYASAAVIILGAVPAMAACPDDITKLRTDLQSDQTFQKRYTAGQIDRAGYMRLFDAAQTFSDMKLEARCQSVLAGIREVAVKADAAATTPPAGTRDDTRANRDDTRANRDDTRIARLRSATPILDARLQWGSLAGIDVRNLADEHLGEVEDVVMDKGQINAIVVERGGFLGMGQSYYLVPAGQVKIAQGSDGSGDRMEPIVVIEMTDAQIKAMPPLTKKDGRWVGQAVNPPAVAPGAPPRRQ